MAAASFQPSAATRARGELLRLEQEAGGEAQREHGQHHAGAVNASAAGGNRAGQLAVALAGVINAIGITARAGTAADLCMTGDGDHVEGLSPTAQVNH